MRNLYVMTLTNYWKVFCNGVNREHREKYIGIGEFLDELANFLRNNLPTETGNPAKNISILNGLYDKETVANSFLLIFHLPLS